MIRRNSSLIRQRWFLHKHEPAWKPEKENPYRSKYYLKPVNAFYIRLASAFFRLISTAYKTSIESICLVRYSLVLQKIEGCRVIGNRITPCSAIGEKPAAILEMPNRKEDNWHPACEGCVIALLER